MKASAKMWAYVKNAIVFQLVGVPVSMAVYLLVETTRGAFPNPSMSLGAWLATALKIFVVYGVTGGVLLSLLHTWLLSRFQSRSRVGTLNRSLIRRSARSGGGDPNLPALVGNLGAVCDPGSWWPGIWLGRWTSAVHRSRVIGISQWDSRPAIPMVIRSQRYTELGETARLRVIASCMYISTDLLGR